MKPIPSSIMKPVWYLDSGASSTMSYDKTVFTEYEPVRHLETVTTASGHRLPIAGRGTITLTTIVFGARKELVLKGALYVPQSKVHLISVREIGSRGYPTVFNDKIASVIALDRQEVVARAYSASIKDLYEILVPDDPNSPSTDNDTAYATIPNALRVTFAQAHEILGHLNPRALRETIYRKRLRNLEIIGGFKDFDCEACRLAKSTKKPHDSVAERKAQHPGHIVSADVIDCRAIESFGNFKFVSVLVDQYTYITSVLILKEKTAISVLEHIQSFQSILKAECNSRIFILRSDRGLEYNNRFLQRYALEQEIKLELGIAHEPRDNGFAERRNRTLIDAAHAMLLSSQLSKKYWPYALEYAAYIQNRAGRRCFEYKTPFEMMFNRAPNVSHLIKFGRKCWVHTAIETTPKFTPKAVEGIFLGISTQSNGYKILVNDKIINARNITLHHPELDLIKISQAEEETYDDVSDNENDEIESPADSKDETIIQDKNLNEQTEKSDELISENQPSFDNTITNQNSIPQLLKNDAVESNNAIEIVTEQKTGRASKLNATSQIQGLFRDSGRALIVTSTEDLPPPNIEIPKGQISLTKTMKGPLAPYWKRARDEEIEKQISLGVFTIEKPPKDANIIRGHFIHTAKTDSHGHVKKLKARLVADGCGQLQGIDYFETYAPTPSPELERLILIHAAALDLEVHQVDVDSAYLHASLDTPVYMRIPTGIDIPHESGEVLSLKRALYGLKQAGRQWSMHLSDLLKSKNWIQSVHDNCLFHRGKNEILLVYVDDILIIAPNPKDIELIKYELNNLFPIKDLGEVHEYLGIEVIRNREAKTFQLRQLGAIDEVIKRDNQNTRIQRIPRNPYIEVIKPDEPATITQHDWYRSVVGQLNYICRITRPDLSLAVNYLARKLSCPTQSDIQHAHKVIGYLMGTRSMFLELRGSDSSFIKVYSDADWAGDETDRKSTSGFVVYLGDAPVHWGSKKQKSIAKSTMEAEYIALSEAALETVSIKNRAEEITQIEIPATLLCDNTAAEHLAKGDPGMTTKRSKHIDLRYHIVRDLVQNKRVEIARIGTKENIADIFTKPLVRPLYEQHRNGLHVH